MNINEGCQMNKKGCSRKTDQKLDTFDWLCDIPESASATDLIEVTFKNTRKGYFRNVNDLTLEKGDVVAVEATPGHDIGIVSMTGQLVISQMKKYHIDQSRVEIKRVYRKVRPNDMERYEESKAKEHDTMLRARKIAEDLKLNMKIGDVEYQGDGNKAIFYYIADERVDFRELIKVLADTFRVRIEMKQIGARQEAGRIGGIGPCGRPLCCSSWMTKFSSVATSSARYQEISLNPQKLAGQCAKLKCCLNFEVDAYVEAQKEIPARNIELETKDGTFYHFKTDVFGKIMQYSSAPNIAANIVSIPVERVKEIIALNKQGIKVDSLLESSEEEEKKIVDFENVVGQDSLTRFDRKKKKKRRPDSDNNRNSGENAESAQNATEKAADAATADSSANATGNQENREKRFLSNRQMNNRPQGNRPQNNRDNRQNNNDENRQNNGEGNNRQQDRQSQGNRNQNDNNRNNRNRNWNRNNNQNQPRENRQDSAAPKPNNTNNNPTQASTENETK